MKLLKQFRRGYAPKLSLAVVHPESFLSRVLKNAHLPRYPAASPSWRRGKKSLLITPPLILPRVEHGAGLLRRTSKYASLLRISGALHLGIFEQPVENDFFSGLLVFVNDPAL
ncbi:MAG TPA: hypothetical protein VLK23_10820 [Thermodesulfobacteriota bacterium]|nr:hypothetical protein [Thermodesulfobacteriota bacterium]